MGGRGGTTCVTNADPFCIVLDGKKDTPSQHFVVHVVPPLGVGGGEGGGDMRLDAHVLFMAESAPPI